MLRKSALSLPLAILLRNHRRGSHSIYISDLDIQADPIDLDWSWPHHAHDDVTLCSLSMRSSAPDAAESLVPGRGANPCTPDSPARHYVTSVGNFSLCAVIVFHLRYAAIYTTLEESGPDPSNTSFLHTIKNLAAA